MELKNISQTKIVTSIPNTSDRIPNCFYLLSTTNGFELYYTDKNKVIKKLTAFEDAPADSSEYVRKDNLWSKLNTIKFTELHLENLNDVKEMGLYGKYNSSEATSALNYPSNAVRGGHLMVLPMTINPSTYTIFQIYWSAGTLSAGEYTDSARVYMRAFVNNSNWTQWREFDGGKLHQFTSATQNLQDLFNNTFPVDNSTFVVNQATTIQVANKTMRVSYIKNTDENIVFQPQSGVTLIGDTTITAPIGTKIELDVQNGRGYINYQKPQGANTQIDNNIGLWG